MGGRLHSLALLLLLAVTLGACTSESAGDAKKEEEVKQVKVATRERIVVLGGSLAEIVYALGADSLLVGADVSSTYPEATSGLAKVGYQRTISAESVMALEPTMILATEEAGPPAAIAQLRESGIRVVVVPTSDHSVEGALRKIEAVGDAIGRAELADRLVDSARTQIELIRSKLASVKASPRVVFIYTRGPGGVQISGRGTAADAMIGLAGGQNAVDGYDGYKPLTAEAAIAADPEVILVPAGALGMIGGIDGLLRQPGLAETRAGRAKRIVAVDDLLLLGFGPRIAVAMRTLAEELHPELKVQS